MSAPAFTYKHMMVGKLDRDQKYPPKVSICSPRSGGQCIELPKVDRNAAFALLVAQQKNYGGQRSV